jgi:Domain of unknown function (DUF1998)
VTQRTVRQSQTIVPFGVGGIFDFRGESFVGCDVWRWGNRGSVIQSDRLARNLRVQGFRAAPAFDPFDRGATAAVPYARFPSWLFCQRCRRMTRWLRAMEDGRVPACTRCKGKPQLVPMRWIQICAKGHIDDVDWRFWAHFGATDPESRQCERNELFFETIRGGGAGGLNTLRVRCGRCKASRSLAGITSPGTLKAMNARCSGRQPWQSRDDAENCVESPKAVQRGASNVYFPVVHSSIEIPPTSRADAYSEQALAIRNDPWWPALLTLDEAHMNFTNTVNMIAQPNDVPAEFVVSLYRDEKRREAGLATAAAATPGDLLSEEWAAFITPMEEGSGTRDFSTRRVGLGSVGNGESDIFVELRGSFDKIVVADRLREVRALEGFHRDVPGRREDLVRVDLTRPAMARRVPWLPAVEVNGEGIFLSLDESRLQSWEADEAVLARVQRLEERMSRHFMAARLRERTGPNLPPRYLLLHTLAHLLLRRLAFESGYSAASLRERVYAKTPLPGEEGAGRQAGVLIYTAAGDSEGTLGGLVRQGEPPRLAETLMQTFEDAVWCSADPLCAESPGQGFGSLNFAACHACCLVSETSCEAANLLLDRTLLIGASDMPGYFSTAIDLAFADAAHEVIRRAG